MWAWAIWVIALSSSGDIRSRVADQVNFLATNIIKMEDRVDIRIFWREYLDNSKITHADRYCIRSGGTRDFCDGYVQSVKYEIRKNEENDTQ